MSAYLFDNCKLDTSRYELNRNGDSVEIEPKVFDLLRYLIENNERVITREELFEHLWPGQLVSDTSLSNQVKAARRAVGDDGKKQAVIKTVHGRGYQFIARIKELGERVEPTSLEGQVYPDPVLTDLKLSDKPSIAVLPFLNLSDDSEQEYFSDGISEDIITALAHFSGLFVIARNSSFMYKNRPIELSQIATELGVRYVVEGSVRRLGKRIRINGQLINAINGHHIWAEKFDGNLDDIFELQDEITRKIVGSIAPQIELSEVERGRGLQVSNLSSYELSLKAKSQFYDALVTGDPNQLNLAIETAEAAVTQDSRSTHALWVQGMALMEHYVYQWGEGPDDALNQAMQTADRLLQIDSANADGFGLRGFIYIMLKKFDLALVDFSHALSLNPNATMNLFMAAVGESLAGETVSAKQHAHLGLHLSPREREFWLGAAYLALALAFFAEENFDEAVKWGRLSIQMHARAPMRRAVMSASCAYRGDLEQATFHATELEALSPGYISNVLRSNLRIYKQPDHNYLLMEGLRKAGLSEHE